MNWRPTMRPIICMAAQRVLIAALVALALGFRAGLAMIGSGIELVLGYAQPSFFGPWGAVALVAAGAGLGLLGSAVAVLRAGRV